jgi:NADPH-dependent glutamate synthase beta subunit-like oxidoreductase/ferredoxin
LKCVLKTPFSDVKKETGITVSNLTVTIDGKKLSAAPGETILNIAQKAGIDIPTLCHNEKISRTTSCFVCVVKDVKTGRFLPSCSACPADGGEYESSTSEVSDMRRSALDLLLSEHTGDCEAPCTVACPAHADVEAYVRAGREGDFLKSLKIIKTRIPLPMSIGRVCPRFCEIDCRKNITAGEGGAVCINDFKRLAADMHYEDYIEDIPEATGKKVAIIGAGPAGLATAYYLRLQGIATVIYEKMPQPGGMLRYGIPEYRLPKDILNKELNHFTKIGVEINCNCELGKDIKLDELKKQFDAVAITIGCWKPSSMRTEGEELAAPGIKWLEKIALNNWQGENPERTIVVGGGNTAMDCLRTSVRLGSDNVQCFYRRTEKEMPAEDIEVMEAREEGVIFNFLTAPVSLRRGNNGLILTCQKMELGEPDASGRRRPVPVEGSEYEVEADTVIAAIGQKTDIPGTTIPANRWGDVEANETSCQIADNIFAAGDCVSGAATVVEGVAGGYRIAQSVAAWFDDIDPASVHADPINVTRGHWRGMASDDLVFLRDDVSDEKRVEFDFLPPEERKQTMEEVSRTLTKDKMMKEGKRCIECSCTARDECKLKQHAETYGAKPDAIKGEKIKSGYDNRHPSIIHDRMKCIKCGICVKICKEVVNENLLSLKQRGFSAKVEAAFGQPLPDSCSECGECIEQCPVGALDWKIKK